MAATLRHLRAASGWRRRLGAALVAASWIVVAGAAGCGEAAPDLRSDAARERGRRLYAANCGLCHGPQADGRGVRAPALSTPPTDFTDPEWRAEASPREVYRAIREGVEGTAMPAWDMLTEEETWDLTAYLLSLAEEGPPAEETAGS